MTTQSTLSIGRDLALVSFLGLAVSAHASSDVVNCDACSSLQKESAAVSETRYGRVYVTDRDSGTITTFDVTTYTAFSPPRSVAVSTNTPSSIQSYFDDLIDEYAQATGQGIRVPGAVAESAHNLAGNAQLQAKVGAWLLDVSFSAPANNDQDEIRDEVFADTVVKLVFPDGSTAEMTLQDYVNADAEFKMRDR